MAGAFDHVLHERLTHNLRIRKIFIRLVNWVNSFLKNKQFTLSFDGKTSALRPVLTNILQGFFVFPILFLFFNAELVEGCEKLEIKASLVKFVNDVNILTYERLTANIYETLSRVHEVYTQ